MQPYVIQGRVVTTQGPAARMPAVAVSYGGSSGSTAPANSTETALRPQYPGIIVASTAARRQSSSPTLSKPVLMAQAHSVHSARSSPKAKAQAAAYAAPATVGSLGDREQPTAPSQCPPSFAILSGAAIRSNVKDGGQIGGIAVKVEMPKPLPRKAANPFPSPPRRFAAAREALAHGAARGKDSSGAVANGGKRENGANAADTTNGAVVANGPSDSRSRKRGKRAFKSEVPGARLEHLMCFWQKSRLQNEIDSMAELGAQQERELEEVAAVQGEALIRMTEEVARLRYCAGEPAGYLDDRQQKLTELRESVRQRQAQVQRLKAQVQRQSKDLEEVVQQAEEAEAMCPLSGTHSGKQSPAFPRRDVIPVASLVS